MPVVIEELDVATAPAAPAPAPAPDAGAAAAEIDPRALQAALAREAWRQDRLAVD
jgi:hypothetical protein